MEVRVGITGNYYITSNNRDELVDACKIISKSIKSIYWSTKYKVWAVRSKSKKHKKKIKEIFFGKGKKILTEGKSYQGMKIKWSIFGFVIYLI